MRRPNVLLICADHWPGRLLDCAGHPCVITPTLDQLAANGVRFTNAYSAAPTCIPARRGLMTGTTPRTYGDRVFNETLLMPPLLTLPQAFYEAGYQTYAVGKLHVYPQRDRIGFCDALINEEGRRHLGMGADDYELFLASEGYAGREFTHAMGANNYMVRPWHLGENLHPTNWTVREMCRTIKRRDPTRPAFWYMSFTFPHPPLVPIAAYLDLYRGVDVPMPFVGAWAEDFDQLPYALKGRFDVWPELRPGEMKLARQAFYAQCTYIDHQIRLVIGLLREEGLLDHTIMLFTSDHGDMLGNHRQFEKDLFYEDSVKIPCILVPTADYRQFGHHLVDDRLVEISDVMPTLLEMAEVPIPDSVEGISLLSQTCREFLYGEHWEDDRATRMVRDQRYKLIYYAVGNRTQLFDLRDDPDELDDLGADPTLAEVRDRLIQELIGNIYGSDLEWIRDGDLVGLPDKAFEPRPERRLGGQRGWRFM
jgi:arylsulfatase A-like enzyme